MDRLTKLRSKVLARFSKAIVVKDMRDYRDQECRSYRYILAFNENLAVDTNYVFEDVNVFDSLKKERYRLVGIWSPSPLMAWEDEYQCLMQTMISNLGS